MPQSPKHFTQPVPIPEDLLKLRISPALNPKPRATSISRSWGTYFSNNHQDKSETATYKHRLTATQAATRSRSLLSRSRVSRAVEAARRVGGGLIVVFAAHEVSAGRSQTKGKSPFYLHLDSRTIDRNYSQDFR